MVERPHGVVSIAMLLRQLMKLRRSAPDIVVAHTHYSIAIALVLWITDRRVRVIAVHHWPTERYPRIVRFIISISRRFNWLTEEIFVSSAILDVQRGVVIPNPVPAKSSDSSSSDAPVDLLVVARHAPEKSIHTAIEALALLDDRTLTLVGGGPLTPLLIDLCSELGVSDRVRFVGTASPSQVRALMRESRAVILPSAWEAMPMVVLEAVAEEANLVLSDISTHAFAIDLGAALAFKQGSASALSAAIESLSDTATLDRLKVGRHCLAQAQSEERVGREWNRVVFGGGNESAAVNDEDRQR